MVQHRVDDEQVNVCLQDSAPPPSKALTTLRTPPPQPCLLLCPNGCSRNFLVVVDTKAPDVPPRKDMSKRTAIHLCFALCGSKDPLKSRSAFSKSVIAKQALLKHKWLRLDPEGTTAVLQTGKHALTQRLGVQVRMLHLAQHWIHIITLAQAVHMSPPTLLASRCAHYGYGISTSPP